MKTVLITGASRGIGLGLVRHILEQLPTVKVIATCRDPAAASQLTELLQSHGQQRLLVLKLDTVLAESHQDVLRQLQHEGIGNIDVVIANAGVGSRGTVLQCTPAEMLDVYNTNVVGSMLTMQAYHDLLCASGVKLMVVISSRLGSIEQNDSGGCAAYRASKAALNMLAVSYAQDTAKDTGCRVITVHPGWVQTDMGESGGRKAPVTVPDSCAGIMRLVQVAADVQLNTHSASPAGYERFARKIAKETCVFAGYDGELLFW